MQPQETTLKDKVLLGSVFILLASADAIVEFIAPLIGG